MPAKAQAVNGPWARFWLRAFAPVKRTVGRWTENRQAVRYGLLTLNVLMLSTISFFVIRGSEPSSLAASDSLSSRASIANPLDQLSSAQIAANTSMALGLAESVAVINQADSVEAESALATANTTVVAKQQAVATSSKSVADIQEYTVKDGDTVASIAAQFNVTSDSVMWSNDLRGDRVDPGTTLLIPPVNGIVYTVKDGDTPDTLAQRYRSNASQIVAFNDAEISGIKTGQRIVIPGGQPPAPTPVRSASAATSYGSTRAVYGGNGYVYGFCTWHAANRRIESGNPLPTNLGNAVTWYRIAASAGLPVGDAPRAGAVLWHRNTGIAGGLGHVGYVERVNDDGSILVSDMNYPSWGRVTYRTIGAGEIGQYRFIY